MSLDLSAPACAENIKTAAETREAAGRSTPDSRQMGDRHTHTGDGGAGGARSSIKTADTLEDALKI